MRKKRILFNMYTLEIGGAEKSLISILKTIDYSKYDVDLFLYQHDGELLNQIPREVTLLKEVDIYKTLCESIKLTIKKGYIKLGVIRVISKYIGIFKKKPLSYDQYMNKIAGKMLPRINGEYDVAISNIWPHDLVVNKVNAKKKIGWIHTDYTKMKIDYIMDRELLSKLDYIISVSEGCKQAFDSVHPMLSNKSIFLENIVSGNFIKNLGQEKILEENLFGDESIKLVTVARLHSEKGVDRAVEACWKLINNGLKVKWFIVGYGQQENEIKSRIKDLGIENNFYVLGKKINPYPYFKACDIYVQPSRYEGKAVAITEAKIFNKPIVITDYTSARDQIDNKETGLIIDNSIEGIYEGVKELIENDELREKIIKNLSEQNWSNEEEIDKIYSLFK